MATWSLGSAMVTRVSESDPEATAHFTFTGTGFDILSYCSSDTGAIIVDIFPGTEVTDTPYKSLMVDSYYQSEGSLYQVPIIKHSGLDYGTWTVQVYVGWSWWNAAGRPNYKWDDFYLDAIRVYDPANDGANSTVVKDAYVSDKEGWPSYQELRNMLITMQTFDALGEEDEVEGIIFIDGNAALDQGQIADYISFGPNNELYLAPGQAVAFNLNVNATDENTAVLPSTTALLRSILWTML